MVRRFEAKKHRKILQDLEIYSIAMINASASASIKDIKILIHQTSLLMSLPTKHKKNIY